jgi:hypothetical protein
VPAVLGARRKGRCMLSPFCVAALWPRLWRGLAFAVAVASLGALVAQGEPPPRAGGADVRQAIRAYLDAGEFSKALQAAEQLPPGDRDPWLAEIARRQASSGAYFGAWDTLGSMRDDLARSSALDSMRRVPERGARGGVTEDDFQPLIDLITATIAPDSWDINGGNGAIMPFVAGVYVDSQGVLRRITSAGGGRLEALRREAARSSYRDNVRKLSELRKVSLTRLERAVQLRWARGEPPDEVMQHLAGLYRVQYVLIYPETGDLVIAGPAGGWHWGPDGVAVSDVTGTPVLLLDDLVVLLRQAINSAEPFGCSINPRPAQLAKAQEFLDQSARRPLKLGERAAWLERLRQLVGQQDIEVFGIPATTHAAAVLVEADYRMKLVGIGLEESVLGVPSYLDLAVENGGVGQQMNVLRWWFAMKYDHVRCNPERTAFSWQGPSVQVLSEREMISARGERVATGKTDELSSRFAAAFTARFDDLAAKYPIYGQLRNVFDLALVARLIESQRLAQRVGWHIRHFGDERAFVVATDAVPKTVESVANCRSVNARTFVAVVSGGVWANPGQWVSASAVQEQADETLIRAHHYGTPEEKALPSDYWWWD